MIITAREYLVQSPDEFYVDAKAIENRLIETQTNPEPLKSINRSFICRTLKAEGLTHVKKPRIKNSSRYQHYPAKLLARLAEQTLEVDFLERYLTSQTTPINFIGMSVKTLKLRQFQRIDGQTNQELIKSLSWFEECFFTPQAVKLDNASAHAGNFRYQRCLSRAVLHLLSRKIIPVFTAPRKPWNNGSVEGSNSVFSRNFWQPHTFTSVMEIEEKLALFNRSSLKHSLYNSACKSVARPLPFEPRVYYIRKVEAIASGKQGCFSIANTMVFIHKEYVNLFVLTEWNLWTEYLTVYFETEHGQAQCIHTQKFPIHSKSKLALKATLNLSEI